MSRSNGRTNAVDANAVDVSVDAAPAVVGVPVTVGTAPVAAAGAPATRMRLHAAGEKAAVSWQESCASFAGLFSVVAPDAAEDAARAPLDLSVCIDVSGSMQGKKMDLMKDTLKLLIARSGLKASDRVSLVTFDSSVTLKLPLTNMNADGRAQAEEIVKSLRAGTQTNLSGGALKAIDVLAQEGNGTPALAAGRTRSVLLFTDGHANQGICDTTRLVSAVSSSLRTASASSGPINFMAFGFGQDHSDGCLRALAEGAGSGSMYYFVGTPEDIPTAFADCLGGLVSVVCQNATLTLTGCDGSASINSVIGGVYNTAASADGASYTIELGDLYASDEKDLLVDLRLASTRAPAAVLATLRAFNVLSGENETVACTLEVQRPESTPADQPTNMAIEMHKMRIAAAETMRRASEQADQGNLERGREMLTAMHQSLMSSPAALTPLGNELTSEIASLSEQYNDQRVYRSVGSKASKMAAMSHARQRSVHSNEDSYAGAAIRKKSMKAAWSRPPAPSPVNEGSDSD